MMTAAYVLVMCFTFPTPTGSIPNHCQQIGSPSTLEYCRYVRSNHQQDSESIRFRCAEVLPTIRIPE